VKEIRMFYMQSCTKLRLTPNAQASRKERI